jgi:hypothetical protein
MAEDFDNYRLIFDGGDDLQAAAAVRAGLDGGQSLFSFVLRISLSESRDDATNC